MSIRLLLVTLAITGSLLMITGNARAGAVIRSLSIITSSTATVQQDAPIKLAESSALENTERNVRDQNDATLTPEDQKETEGDIKITTDIRQAVVSDKSLSINAQNVKIITRNGVVTLRGPVENEAESTKLHHIALQTPGVVKVDNQLENKAP